MSSTGEKDGPDASGILANLWRLIQAVMDDSEGDLEALGISAKAFFLLAEVDRLAHLLRMLCAGTGKRIRRFAELVSAIRSG